MAKVSFYLFEKSPERQVESACRLCRKILTQAQQKIWLYCTDPNIQQQLDEQLWTFDASSFIPHGINQLHAPICISAQLPTDTNCVLFNFNNQALEQYASFSHIIEIIENNADAKQIGREKFKQYRQFGIEPHTFKL